MLENVFARTITILLAARFQKDIFPAKKLYSELLLDIILWSSAIIDFLLLALLVHCVAFSSFMRYEHLTQAFNVITIALTIFLMGGKKT